MSKVNEVTVDLTRLPEMVNDVYLPHFTSLEHRTNVWYGGAGSGKSKAMAQMIIFRMLHYRDQRWLAMRKVAGTLEQSVVRELLEVVSEWGLDALFVYSKKARVLKCSNTDSEVVFVGLDDPEKIKSVSGVTSIWMEEASEFEEDDYRQLQLRLRGQMKWKDGRHQVWLTFNPISRDNWTYKEFFADVGDIDEEASILHTTYRDNYFLDRHYIKTLHSMRRSDPAKYQVYCLGHFADVDDDSRFYRSFQLDEHVGNAAYNPDLPLWVSVDFNRLPGMTLLIAQVRGNTLSIIDEITEEHQTTEEAAKALLKKYPNHASGMFLTGDCNGNQRQTQSKLSDVQIMMRVLAPYDPVNRFPSSNPRIAQSGQFVNRVFARAESELGIVVDARCEKSIQDFLSVKMDASGAMVKKKGRYKGSNLVIELKGHCSDALRYLVVTVFGSHFNKYLKGPAAGKIGSVRRKRGRFNY